jgi:hypothetical protein
MKNSTRATILLIILSAAISNCSRPSRFSSIERILQENGVALSSDKIIVYNDKACDLCVKNLEYFIDHMPSKEFHLVYTTDSRKARYENSIVKDMVPKERFSIISNSTLFDELAKTTSDFKGIYLLSVSGNSISKVEPIDNNSQ